VAQYVKKHADLLFIITNDGWWGNTPGHRQHLQYARLRAIEMRRSIARSANTGISCFIDQRGDILQPTRYWEEDVISATVNANDKITFYARFGDFLAKAALIGAAAMLVLVIIRRKGER
jgi:apolipoprotein N-acyltransferase